MPQNINNNTSNESLKNINTNNNSTVSISSISNITHPNTAPQKITESTSNSELEKNKNSNNNILQNDSSVFKKLILKELSLNDKENPDLLKDDIYFQKFIDIKLMNETRKIEQLRSENLSVLQNIIDKCINNEKFNDSTIENIFNYINRKNKQDLLNLDPNLTKKPFLTSEDLGIDSNKKRKINTSPKLGSPRGHRRYRSEIPSFANDSVDNNNHDKNTRQAVQLPAPSVAAATGTNPIGTTANAAGTWPTQGSVQQQLTAPSYSPYHEHPPQQIQTTRNIYSINQHQHQHQQQGYQQNYFQQPFLVIPPNSNESMTHQQENNPPSTYYNVIQQQQPFQYQSQHAMPSPYRQQPQLSPHLQQQASMNRKGHRRSQSAAVVSANNNEFKSPQRLNQLSQRPVNFLIHTPKHPPPT